MMMFYETLLLKNALEFQWWPREVTNPKTARTVKKGLNGPRPSLAMNVNVQTPRETSHDTLILAQIRQKSDSDRRMRLIEDLCAIYCPQLLGVVLWSGSRFTYQLYNKLYSHSFFWIFAWS